MESAGKIRVLPTPQQLERRRRRRRILGLGVLLLAALLMPRFDADPYDGVTTVWGLQAIVDDLDDVIRYSLWGVYEDSPTASLA
jgi:hypothetical protein